MKKLFLAIGLTLVLATSASAAAWRVDSMANSTVSSFLITNLANVTNLATPYNTTYGTNAAGVNYTNLGPVLTSYGTNINGLVYTVVSTNIIGTTAGTSATTNGSRVVGNWTANPYNYALNYDNNNLLSDATFWTDTQGDWPLYQGSTGINTNVLAYLYLTLLAQGASSTGAVGVIVAPLTLPGAEDPDLTKRFVTYFNPSTANVANTTWASYKAALPATFIGYYGARVIAVFSTNNVANSGYWVQDVGIGGYRP